LIEECGATVPQSDARPAGQWPVYNRNRNRGRGRPSASQVTPARLDIFAHIGASTRVDDGMLMPIAARLADAARNDHSQADHVGAIFTVSVRSRYCQSLPPFLAVFVRELKEYLATERPVVLISRRLRVARAATARLAPRCSNSCRSSSCSVLSVL
jgi:hypothetical protein